MKAVTTSKPFSITSTQFGAGSYASPLLPDVSYVWENTAASYLRIGTQDCGNIQIDPIPNEWVYPDTEQTVAIFCPGGIGDALMVTSVARQIHEDTGSRVYAITTPFNYPVFDQPFMAGCMHHPVRWDVLYRFDQVLSYEELLAHPGFNDLSYNDLFADIAGIDELRYEVPQYRPTDGDRMRARALLPSTGKPRIGIHLRGSMWPKNWPLSFCCRTAVVLAEAGFDVLLLGSYGQFSGFHKLNSDGQRVQVDPPEGIHNMCGHLETVGDLAATVEMCDLLICPDSAVMHLCGALGKPGILLSGPFPSNLRAGGYPTVVGIDSPENCMGCRATMECPEKKCVGVCEAMGAIKPDQVVECAMEMMA